MTDKPLPPTLAESPSAGRLQQPLRTSIAAAQAWWREAGVDLAFHDEPQGWLAEDGPTETPAAVVRKAAPPEKPRIGGDPSAWPQDLPAFREWWLEEPTLDEVYPERLPQAGSRRGGPNPRIAPRGEAGAALMLLVPMPEAEDRETLLSGPEGRLLASLATAMGLTPDRVYLAPALPRHTLLPDWDRLRAEGLGEVLLHHLRLASPQRLIVLGTRILPLLGHDPAQAAPGVSELAIQGRSVPMLTSYAPERLLGNARQRAGLWQRWLDWTDGDTG